MASILLVFSVGVIAGFLNTIAGGGSLLSLPILIFLGLPPAVANGSNRLAILLQNLVGSITFWKMKVLNVKLALFLAFPAVIGSFFGARFAIEMDPQIFNRLLAGIIIVMILIGLRKKTKRSQSNEPQKMGRLILSWFVFLGIGVYGGFIQAGVGYLLIGALTLINGLDLVRTNAIKVTVVFFYTAVALATFISSDLVNWKVAINLSAGNMLGAYIGANFAITKGQDWIERILIVSEIVMAIKLLTL